jgi:Carboxypeptidase regulatory-like domain
MDCSSAYCAISAVEESFMKSVYLLVSLVAALLELLLLAPAAFGQTASISGTVTDSTGALVQHATVTATNTATNIARSTETGTAGVYSLTELVAGPYDLTIEKRASDWCDLLT